MTQTATVEKPSTAPARKKVAPKKFTKRPPIDAAAIYPRREAAYAVGTSVVTLIRAWVSGNLAGYTSGNRVSHSGAHLLAWLEAGGKTS